MFCFCFLNSSFLKDRRSSPPPPPLPLTFCLFPPFPLILSLPTPLLLPGLLLHYHLIFLHLLLLLFFPPLRLLFISPPEIGFAVSKRLPKWEMGILTYFTTLVLFSLVIFLLIETNCKIGFNSFFFISY